MSSQLHLCEQSLSTNALTILNQVRTNPPARKVSNGGGNVMGFLLSQKMSECKKLWFESIPEKQYAYWLEYDPKVLQFFHQPLKIPLGMDQRGRERYHIPDFLVFRCHSLTLVEIKPFYGLTSDPELDLKFEKARQWSEPLGLQYVVVTSRDLPDELFLDNIMFLTRFKNLPDRPRKHTERLLEWIHRQPGISVLELVQHFCRVDRKELMPCIWHLIYHQYIRVDLQQERLRPRCENRLSLTISNDRASQ